MDCAKKRECGSHMNLTQKELLIDFLSTNPKLNSGRFDSNFSAKQATVLWKTITEKLNSIPGAFKDWKGWRKAWYDLKAAVKFKNAEIRKQQSGTGGGRRTKLKLTPQEEKISMLIATTSVTGDEEITETPVNLELFQGTADGTINNSVVINTENQGDIEDIINDERPVLPAAAHKCTTSRPRKRRRVETTLQYSKVATDAFADKCQQKIGIKKAYYEKKIEILERIAKAKEQIAQSVGELSESAVAVAKTLTRGTVNLS